METVLQFLCPHIPSGLRGPGQYFVPVHEKNCEETQSKNMFEESTVWMQPINYFGSTENTDGNIDSKSDDVTVGDSVYGLFTNLSYIEDTVAIRLIVFLGSLLNLVVFRCYWR